MPLASSLVGTITVRQKVPTMNGTLVRADVEDLATGVVESWAFAAPKAAATWDDAALLTWLRDAAVKRMENIQQREAAQVIEAMRAGGNPLRDAAGNPIGTTHLAYDEVATRVYTELSASIDPHDRIIGARLVQSLTDSELAAITGLDAAGIQQLRNQVSAALQAAALMQQAGGVI